MNQSLLDECDSSVAFEPAQPPPAYAESATEAFTLAMRSRPAPWLASSVRRLADLLELGENWDSYGAAPVDEQSVQVAAQFLIELAHITGVTQPSITASPEGHVGMAWDFGQASLEVVARSDGRFHYVYLDETDEQQDCEEITADPSAIVALLTKL